MSVNIAELVANYAGPSVEEVCNAIGERVTPFKSDMKSTSLSNNSIEENTEIDSNKKLNSADILKRFKATVILKMLGSDVPSIVKATVFQNALKCGDDTLICYDKNGKIVDVLGLINKYKEKEAKTGFAQYVAGFVAAVVVSSGDIAGKGPTICCFDSAAMAAYRKCVIKEQFASGVIKIYINVLTADGTIHVYENGFPPDKGLSYFLHNFANILASGGGILVSSATALILSATGLGGPLALIITILIGAAYLVASTFVQYLYMRTA
jgi:uncharacterized protein YbaA (DUF1428 family)